MRPLRSIAFVPLLLLPASWSAASVVNVDFQLLGEPTQSGSVGVLSTTGSVWNGVVVDSNAALLVDEFGVPTPFDLVFLDPTDPYVDLAAGSDLRRSGITGAGFEIRNLVPDSTYTLAVYASPNTGFSVQHGGGSSGGPCTSGVPSFMLPGQEGKDFCLFEGLVPLDLGNGEAGLRVVNLDGAITGIQLLGPAGGEPPPLDTTPPECEEAGGTGGPAVVVRIRIQDAGSGLATIAVILAENATATVPPFDPGTLDPVFVDVAPVDPALPGAVEIASMDVAGNGGSCRFEFPASPECQPVANCCREMLAFFDNEAAEGTLVGSGPGNSPRGRLGALRNMLREACGEIAGERTDEACGQLEAALGKTDGESPPPDFVSGPAAPELAARIRALRATLGCEGAVAEILRRSVFPAASERTGTWGMIKARYGSTDRD